MSVWDFAGALLILAGLLFALPGFASVIPCVGDCANDDRVSVDELVKGVNIALGNATLNECRAFDRSGDERVSVDELVAAVNRALNGCFETIALPKLPGTTEVVYDSLGIPHIYGPDLNSVAYTQGYVQAANRFWQMDISRRWGEGRLSELFGTPSLNTDVTMRTLLTATDGRRLADVLWERLLATDPEIAAMIEAYTDGVNAWLADLRAGRNEATLPPEYGSYVIHQGPNDLAPWRPQDTASIHLSGWWTSDEWNLFDIMAFQAMWETLDEATRKDALRPAPFAFVPVVASAQPMARAPLVSSASVPSAPPRPGVARAVHSLLDEVARTSPFDGRAPRGGSNNWVIAPSLSDSGFAMLASDPHVGLSNPANFFLQQLDVTSGPAMRASGVSVPGLPGFIWGHSESGAWAGTTSYFQNLDVYVETITTPPDYPASPRTVLFHGEQVNVRRIEEQFLVNSGPVVTYPIEVVPHHGPMLPDPDLRDGLVGLAATGMTMRWTGQELGNGFRTYLDFMRAQNAAAFRAALRSNPQAVGPANLVWADVHGDIVYFPYALLPQRPSGTVPYAPMPGTGEAEWLTDAYGNPAWLTEDQFPQALNPPQGFIATANSDPTGHTRDNDPLNDGSYFAAWYDDALREQRIQEMLSNRANLRPPGAKITMADMSAYQYDTASLDALRMLPFLFTAAQTRPTLLTTKMTDAITRLQAWMQEKPDSPACNVVSGVDAHESRTDVPPRAQAVSEEERQDAVASSIYHAWVKQIWEALPPEHNWQLLWPVPWRLVLHLLQDIDQTDPAFRVYTKGANGDSTLWDNPGTPEVETRTEVLLGALSRSLVLLEQIFGSADMSTWLYGTVHQASFQHSIGLPSYNLGPFPVPGGFWTVNPGYPGGWGGKDASDFTFSLGAAQRLVVLLDPAGIKAVNILPGGQNGNPGDWRKYNKINPTIHYGDLIPGWINGDTVEMRISRQAVAADNQRHVRYVPAEE